MPRFKRTKPAPTPQGSGYQAFRQHVRLDFESRCAYCLIAELLAGGEENFELDHFRPKSKFPKEELNFYNLYYVCHPCNNIKRNKWPSSAHQKKGIGFVDLCATDFDAVFEEDKKGGWRGLNDSAWFTIDMLRLNRRHLLEIRVLIARLGPLL